MDADVRYFAVSPSEGARFEALLARLPGERQRLIERPPRPEKRTRTNLRETHLCLAGRRIRTRRCCRETMGLQSYSTAGVRQWGKCRLFLTK